jgi:hypothetical protein
MPGAVAGGVAEQSANDERIGKHPIRSKPREVWWSPAPRHSRMLRSSRTIGQDDRQPATCNFSLPGPIR